MSRGTDHFRDAHAPLTERVKKQLLWAYDPAGRIDADRFLTILAHEHVRLTRVEMIELASELTPAARHARASFIASSN